MPHSPRMVQLPLSAATSRVTTSAIRDLLSVIARPDLISLAGGLPATELFPTEAIAAAAAAELVEDPGQALQYSATEGYEPLRAWVAARRGAETGQVVVTHGSQQALDLVMRALVDPGATVALADPAYVGAVQAIRVAGGKLTGIPADADGLRVDRLAERLQQGLRPALVYVVSNHDNPSGATLPEARRRHLADLAERYGFWIVDDDPYRELSWGAPLPPPLATFSDQVITLGSFSKILSPGLRVGYSVTPPALARSLVLLKQAADLHTSSLSQRITHRVIAAPTFLPSHLPRLTTVYAERAGALADGLTRSFGDALEFTVPDGGMFIWARFREPVDTQVLLAAAIDRGVAFVPGAAFSAGADHRAAMRVSYATRAPADLRVACDRIADAWQATDTPDLAQPTPSRA